MMYVITYADRTWGLRFTAANADVREARRTLHRALLEHGKNMNLRRNWFRRDEIVEIEAEPGAITLKLNGGQQQ